MKIDKKTKRRVRRAKENRKRRIESNIRTLNRIAIKRAVSEDA